VNDDWIMRTTYDPNSYPPSSFDDDFCLRPPLLLVIILLYLSRAAFLPIVTGIGHYAGVNEDAMRVLRASWQPATLLVSLPALPVLYALCRRLPSASQAVRRAWEHGRILIAISIAIDIVLNVRELIPFTGLDDQSLLPICGGVADLYFLIYVLAARRVRDTFCDFPPAPHGDVPKHGG
jgi:hypothetical protein